VSGSASVAPSLFLLSSPERSPRGPRGGPGRPPLDSRAFRRGHETSAADARRLRAHQGTAPLWLAAPRPSDPASDRGPAVLLGEPAEEPTAFPKVAGRRWAA
jgi:hypothetical protein